MFLLCFVFVLVCLAVFVCLLFSYIRCSRARSHWCFDHTTSVKKNKVGPDTELEVELSLKERRNSSQVKPNGSKYDNIQDHLPGSSKKI